jgi:hypothetical protein
MEVKSKMNPDLKEERGKVPFSVEEFTNWFHDGAEKVKEKRFLGEWMDFSGKFNFQLVVPREILVRRSGASRAC